MSTITYLVWIFFVFLPAGLANMTPVLVNNVPLLKDWKTPLDFGKSFRGKRVFGANKTWRGLVSGTVVAAVASLQLNGLFGINSGNASHSLLTGAALGFGALMGDAVESFFKRQRGIPSGESWFPFDQIDYIIGGLLIGSPFMKLRPLNYLAILIMYFMLHLIVSFIGFKLNLKDKPI